MRMITQVGFECLTFTSKSKSRRAEVKIAPDRENSSTWFVDYTRNRSKTPSQRVVLNSKELRCAFGVTDRRVKHTGPAADGKYFRYGKVVSFPGKNGIAIRITPTLAGTIREITNIREPRK